MPTVFVTQVPHRRDNETRALVPIFNLAPAQEFGELQVLMPPSAPFFDTKLLDGQLRNVLRSYRRDDSLLMLGDSVLIAATLLVVSRFEHGVAVLRWDRNMSRYQRVVVQQ